MKKSINTFALIILLIISGLPATSIANEIFTYNITTNLSEISVTETERGSKYYFETDDYLDIDGGPEIPFKIIRLALPPNTKISSVTSNGSQISIIAHDVDYAWYEGEMKTDIDASFNPAPKNEEIYNSSDIYPGTYVELLNHGVMGTQHLACFAVYPIQYRPIDGELIMVGEIDIEIHLDSDLLPQSGDSPEALYMVSQMVNNPEGISNPTPSPNSGGGTIPGETLLGIGAEYLIITSAELAPAFYPFAVWKNQKGVLTEIVLIEDILARYSGEDDAARLREYLKEAHLTGARWVLLGGDEDIIPIRYAYPGNVNTTPALKNQQISDLYFADLTGDWDVDGDGVYGEYVHDQPDVYPEVYVGRIPAASPEEVEIWVGKALMYEQNPNNGDYDYLTRGLFIINDQMRDLNQHIDLAGLMPDNFYVDNSSCAEEPSGGALEPTQPSGEQIVAAMNQGWGYISNHNHGGFYYYAARTPGYNNAPRSDMYGDTIRYTDEAGALSHLDESTKYGVHYSISCYNAAYDFEKEIFWSGPFITDNSFMEAFLFLPQKGGVAYLGNTRWGWVSSSNLLEKKFVEYVYSDTARQLAVAETLSKLYYPTKRDLGYGHSLFGDPEMRIWANAPIPLNASLPEHISLDSTSITVEVSTADGPAANINVTAWKPGEMYLRGTTDESGQLDLPLDLTETGYLYITAVGQDYLPSIDTIIVHLQSAIGDNANPDLPLQTSLFANYPNPFNATTSISYALATAGQVKLEIFNITGGKVKTLIDGYQDVGTHSLIWDGLNDLGKVTASGTYFYRLKTDNESFVKKMALLK